MTVRLIGRQTGETDASDFIICSMLYYSCRTDKNVFCLLQILVDDLEDYDNVRIYKGCQSLLGASETVEFCV